MSDRNMSKEAETGNTAAELRRKAEAKMAAMDSPDISAPDTKALIHELRTHQIELEMQNEELRRSETELAEARDSYADLYDFAPVGYVSINSKGFIKQANLTMTDMLGVDRRDLINRLFSNFVVVEDEDIYYLHRKTIFDSERRKSTELRLKKSDGNTFWAQIESTVQQCDDADAYHLMAISDIDKRKHAEESLYILSRAIEQAGEAIIITDREGVIEFANPAFVQLTGYSTAEAIGQTPRMLKSGSQDDAFYADMWNTITSGKSFHGKIIDRRKDGSFYPAMLTISAISDQSCEASSYSHFVAIQSDLSSFEDMEHQFHQAQKMEALGTMVGGIAHNFNQDRYISQWAKLPFQQKGARLSADDAEAEGIYAELLRTRVASQKASEVAELIN